MAWQRSHGSMRLDRSNVLGRAAGGGRLDVSRTVSTLLSNNETLCPASWRDWVEALKVTGRKEFRWKKKGTAGVLSLGYYR